MSDYRSYEYDEKSQLTRENNATTNKTTVWTYDTLGNITSKSVYPYTTGALGTAEQTLNYTYSNDSKSGWNHLLTGVGNDTITYDEIGNPTNYLGATLSWRGRELASYNKGNKNISYSYNVDGMRYKKVVKTGNTVTATYDYVYSDEKLVLLTHTENGVSTSARFIYDSAGYVRGFILNDSAVYMYLKNAQGDVSAVVDESGKIIIRYSYNAWGETEFTVPSGVDPADTALISKVSPLCYRGYCYDFDIGLYYLQSRYYDPSLCRFINADSTDYLGATGTPLSYNLFAYCENDPVNNVDPKGAWGDDVHKGYSIYKTSKTRKYAGVYTSYIQFYGYYGTFYWAKSIGYDISIAKKIGDCSYSIDSFYPAWIPTESNQSWHFNTWSTWDSRSFLSMLCVEIACEYLEKSLEFYNTNFQKCRLYLGYAIQYLGYSLHPVQDMFAHTSKVSILRKVGSVSYWSHLSSPNADKASKNLYAVYVQTYDITFSILYHNLIPVPSRG